MHSLRLGCGALKINSNHLRRRHASFDGQHGAAAAGRVRLQRQPAGRRLLHYLQLQPAARRVAKLAGGEERRQHLQQGDGRVKEYSHEEEELVLIR